MGLDTTHDCWHGPCSAFNRWRMKLAEIAGIPLPLMEGFYDHPLGGVHNGGRIGVEERAERLNRLKHADSASYGFAVAAWVERAEPFLPLKWEQLRPDVLHLLLNHSDCDGYIDAGNCRSIADRLEKILHHLPDEDDGGHIGNWRDKTQRFIDGLRAAWDAGENVEFH